MCKIFTVTVHKKKFSGLWKAKPSFAGKIVMSDDMRFIGCVNDDVYTNKGNESYVDGTFISNGKQDLSIGFYQIDPETGTRHVYLLTELKHGKVCDGLWGICSLDDHDNEQVKLMGEFRIEVREYGFLEKVAHTIMKRYEDLSELKPHNEELLYHVNLLRGDFHPANFAAVS